MQDKIERLEARIAELERRIFSLESATKTYAPVYASPHATPFNPLWPVPPSDESFIVIAANAGYSGHGRKA